MAGPWEKYAAPAAAPATSGPWAKYGAAPAAVSAVDQIPVGADERAFGEQERARQAAQAQPDASIGRQLGLGARHVVEGVGDIADLAATPFRVLVNTVLPDSMQAQPGTGRMLSNAAGLPTPATPTERVVGDVVRNAAGAVVPIGAAGQIARTAVGPVTRSVAQEMAARPLVQLASAGGGGGAGGIARENDVGPLGQLAASVAGGVAAPMVAQDLFTTAIRNPALRRIAEQAAAQNAADDAVRAGATPGGLRDLVRRPPQSTIAGGGAAETGETLLRRQRAADLGLAPLTEGQATRKPDQVRFERETSKREAGAPLQNRFDLHNEQLLSKFDEFFDEVGASAPTLRAGGKVVDDAVVRKYQDAQDQVRKAYQAAREAGQLDEPVEYRQLSDFLDKHTAEMTTGNVPMLAAVRAKLEKLDPDGTGLIPVNEAEELRKMASRLTQDGTPNAAYIGDVKRLIDQSMDGASGDLYRQARRLRENMASQFEDHAIISKMLRFKPGSKDRAVALEDLTDHAVFGGGYDDVQQVKRVLTAYGKDAAPEAKAQGMKAWQELQGATLRKLQSIMFPEQGAQNAAGDVGARAAAFKKAITDLDADERLTVVFGKVGAQKLRDLADTAIDVNYSKGANTSGTSEATRDIFKQVLRAAKAVPGLNLAAKQIEKGMDSRETSKRVKSALGENE